MGHSLTYWLSIPLSLVQILPQVLKWPPSMVGGGLPKLILAYEHGEFGPSLGPLGLRAQFLLFFDQILGSCRPTFWLHFGLFKFKIGPVVLEPEPPP